MGVWLVVCLGVCGVVFGWSTPAEASGPTSEIWRSITTEHFRVSYHEGVAPIAPEVAQLCEAAHQRLAPFFQYEPRRRTEVVLIDGSEAANGSATAYPRAQMVLYAVPPSSLDTRTDSDHWMWELILHEYAHILHLDQVHGWIRVLNFPVGRLWMPNQILPRWYTEGLATALESRETGAGRIRSHFYGMYLRAALLEDRIPTLGQLSNSPPKFPFANAWYLIGGNFLYAIGERYGWEVFAVAAYEQSRRLRPYAINYMALSAIGETFDTLYARWHEVALEEARQVQAQIEREGRMEPERLTHGHQNSRWVETSSDGRHTWWVESDGKDEPRFVPADASQGTAFRFRGSQDFALSPDGQYAVISAQRPYLSGYFRNELYRVDLRTQRVTRLSRGTRAQSPAISPDGRQIAYIAPVDGRLDLFVWEEAGGPPRRIVRAPDWSTIGDPSWSPDGRTIYFSMSEARKGRDLYAIAVDDLTLTRLTNDRAIDESPSLSPDGKWLFYSSDRDGLFNIYARNLEITSAADSEGQLVESPDIRLTRVLYGVFTPKVSRQGDRCYLYLSTFGAEGFDIARLALNDDCSPPAGEAAPISYTRDSPPIEAHPIPAHDHRYRLLVRAHPWSWSPVYEQVGSYRQLGFSTSGSDPAGVLLWALSATLGEPENQIRWNAEMVYAGLTPELRLRAGRSFVHRSHSARQRTWIPYDEIIDTFGVSTGYRFGGYRLTQNISGGWSGEYRRLWQPTDFSPDPGSLKPVFPTLGARSSLFLSWSASNLRSYSRSVSVERGWSADVTLRIRAPWTGSDVRSREMTWGVMKALPIHRFERHAFVVRLRGAHSANDWNGSWMYALGGAVNQNILDALINQYSAPTSVVRGYDLGARFGANYLLLNAEYRFPIWWIDRAHSSIPLAFERLTGAVFVDSGLVWGRIPRLEDGLLGVGAELQLRFRLGYFLDQSIRTGVGRGMGPDGIWNWYLVMGSSF